MRILFVSAELTPLAKVGGLADVAGSLPKALKELGIDVRVAMPKYEIIDEKKYQMKLLKEKIPVKVGPGQEFVNIYETKIPKSEVPIYLIDNLKYLGKDGVYPADHREEIFRFSFFSKAILEIFSALGWTPEVLHCHDWHVGILPGLLKIRANESSKSEEIKTVFTVHNLAMQGLWSRKEVLDFLSISGNETSSLKVRQPGSYGENINLIQQGILGADFVTTVSPTYAKEIANRAYQAWGLMETIKSRQENFIGILNGIDTDYFDPSTDLYIETQYSSKKIKKKIENKLALQREMGLFESEFLPLFGMVARLTFQKGVDILTEITDKILELGAQFVFLGTGEKRLENMLLRVAGKNHRKVATVIKFDSVLAQKIYAGSDFFLMPSKFEPCGLGQLIAMRYGTIPIVRATGGLKDTVKSVIYRKREFGEKRVEGEGFIFKGYSSDKLLKTMKRALEVYRDKIAWQTLQRHIMEKDFSWAVSAKKYIELYKKLIKR